ncbi:MAG: hypothetical protein K2X44_05100 [Magnetospirillum sp.]|nr:hypothetical protein [Magnetospirillum sp.]
MKTRSTLLLKVREVLGSKSLMYWCELYAKGEVKIDGEPVNFIVASGELKEDSRLRDIVHMIADRLRREVEARDKVVSAGKKVFDFVKQFEAFGIKYKEATSIEKEFTLIDDLAELIKDIMHNQFLADGVLILLDEADKPLPSAHLGMLCKLLTERLTKIGCDRCGIGLAGLPELMDKLEASHSSSVRVFETFTLQPLLMHERAQVIDAGLDSAEKINKFKTSITPDARALICHLSEGYPHFLQQFAYSSFDMDEDNTIDAEDVSDAMFKENGALHQLGRKYFENILFVYIRSENYRKVLMAMAEHMDEWVDRKTIKLDAGVSETVVNNALNALKSRKIIIHSDRVKGGVQASNKIFCSLAKGIWLC